MLRALKQSFVALALALWATAAGAAVTPNSVIEPQTFSRGVLQMPSTDSTSTFYSVYSGGTNGSKCIGLLASNTDTSAHTITVAITNGGTNYVIGTVSVPVSAGTVAGTAAQNLLTTNANPTAGLIPLPFDNAGNPLISLVSGDTLTINPNSVPASGKFINVYAQCEDF